MPVTLPDWIEGVVFIEEDGAKRILCAPEIHLDLANVAPKRPSVVPKQGIDSLERWASWRQGAQAHLRPWAAEDSGVPISARFCFYDQIHTTGQPFELDFRCREVWISNIGWMRWRL